MVPVLRCLGILKAHFDYNGGKESIHNHSRMRWNLAEAEGINCSQGDVSICRENSAFNGEGRQKNSIDGKYRHGLHGSAVSGMLPFP